MNHAQYTLRLDLLRSISRLMHQIETDHGLMFSQIDSEFEDAIFNAIDSKSVPALHLVIKKLEQMHEVPA